MEAPSIDSATLPMTALGFTAQPLIEITPWTVAALRP
jgi:hypothetical protein